MKESNNEQDLVAFVKHQLDQSVQSLDAATLSCLRRARHEARHSRSKRVPWLWPVWGFATASASVLAVTLWLGHSVPNGPDLSLEDLDLLASAESLDLYEDLEFYGWLVEGDHAS